MLQHGFFAEAGPLQLFVSNHVRSCFTSWFRATVSFRFGFYVLSLIYIYIFSPLFNRHRRCKMVWSIRLVTFLITHHQMHQCVFFSLLLAFTSIYSHQKNLYIYSNVFLQVRIQKDCEVLLKITTVSVVATEIVRTIPITLFIMQLK